MKRFMNKKVLAIGLAAGLTLGGAGAAFAYFTSTGGGSGSATTGSSAALNIAQVGSVSNLLPGGPSQTINYKVTNNTPNAENVGSVTVTATSVTSGTLTGIDSEGNTIVPCSTSFYPIVQGAALNTDLAPGGSVSGTASISMSDTGNQDNCQLANGGGALTLSFSSN
jgi:hypothetical protein